MGLTQSSRKITITNDDPKLINVSAELVERLAQGITNDSEKSSQEHMNKSPGSYASQSNIAAVPGPLYSSNAPVSQRAEAVNYPSEYTLSALQMQQLKERELQDQEIYWQRRLQNMEQNHAKINKIFDDEYKKAVDEFVNKKAGKDKIQGSITPCLQNSEEVLKCYQDHPKEILKCANLVEKFSSCVDQRRAQVIAAR